jgi:hypothetical protein
MLVVIPNVIALSVVMLNVLMLSVVAPLKKLRHSYSRAQQISEIFGYATTQFFKACKYRSYSTF